MVLLWKRDMNQQEKQYLKDVYGEEILIYNCEDKNLAFDIFVVLDNLNVKIELKNRYFTNDYIAKQKDILIEIIQNVPDIKNIDVENVQLNNLYKINTSIGWFYKCDADRLIFFRYVQEVLFDVIDIDFKLFKGWFLNNINTFDKQYSGKTTKTINAVVKLSNVPKIFYKYICYL